MKLTFNEGDRYVPAGDVGVMEWVDGAWTPVCRRDDIAMTETDENGWLRCPTCKTRAVDETPPADTSTLSRARR